MARLPNIPFLHLLEGRIGELREMRFWSKVDMRTPEECWNWQASLNHHGYGRFKLASEVVIHSNRMAWALANRTDPGEQMVLHGCDNPACCNPSHLRLGTPGDNIRDMDERGRRVIANQAGEANGAAKLDESALALIVSRLREGWTNKQIACGLPVGHALISRIRTGRSWAKQAAALGWEPKPVFQRRRAA